MPDTLTHLRSIDRLEHALGRATTELLQVGVDTRELGARVRREELPVVVSDHGEVVGNGAPEIARRIDDAPRDLIGCREHRVDLRVAPEKGGRGIPSPVLGPISRERLADEFEPGVGER